MKETRFKYTDIGNIPENWEIAPIKELTTINTGSKNTQDKSENGVYPFLCVLNKLRSPIPIPLIARQF